jgi:hypothetical protein
MTEEEKLKYDFSIQNGIAFLLIVAGLYFWAKSKGKAD